jgi:septal ring factor EnvC (AmiA/AmiB activator)
MDTAVTIAIIGAVASIMAVILTNRVATRSAQAAQRRTAEIERTKVDSEAYKRARDNYDAALATQDKRIRELTTEMEDDRREYRAEIAECKSRIRELEDARTQDRRTLVVLAAWARQILVILRSHEIEFPPPPPELDAI